MKKNYLLFVVILLITLSAIGQNPGSFNPEFSTNGWDTIYGNNNGLEVKKLLMQADGKLLISAQANFSNEGSQSVLVRYNTNGTLDTSFGGGDGMIRSVDDQPDNWEGEYLYTDARSATLQSTGKIIVGGDKFYSKERLLRFNTDGSLDTSFGIDGIVDMNRSWAEFIYHIGVQSDDKIIVCGILKTLSNGEHLKNVFLWRFTVDGVLDTTFGVNGEVRYTRDAWLNSNYPSLKVNELLILPDNSIIINQSYTSSIGSCVMLCKLNSNGSINNSFGSNGNAIKFLDTYQDINSSSALQVDGSIISSMSKFDGSILKHNESIFRMNAQGQLDSNFEINIPLETQYPSTSKVLAHNNVIYLWTKDDVMGYNFDEIRSYTLSGDPINEFGTSGVAFINQEGIPISQGGGLAIANDGSIFISSVADALSSNDYNFLTFRLFGADSSLFLLEPAKSDGILAYPNPTTGSVTLSISDNATIDKVEIMDSLGRIVFTETTNTSEIDLSIFSSGIYIFKVYSSKNIIQKYIIKQ